MRLHHLGFLLVLIAGCAPQPPGAGTEGHPCRTGFSANWACNEGLRCTDEGCVACGKAGEMCCFHIGQGDEYCDSSDLACEDGNGGYDENPGQCTATCGTIGVACCDNPNDPCPGSGECVGGTCEASLKDPCYSETGEAHLVYVVSQEDCQYTAIPIKTDTLEQAEECRQQLIDSYGATAICPIDQVPADTQLCLVHNGDYSSIQFPSCSADQLALCEQNYCNDEDCSWTEGFCP